MPLVMFLCAVALANPDYDAGVAAVRAGDDLAARAAFERCMKATDGTDAECLWELGWLHWKAGRWSEVVSHWDRVAQLDPDHDGLDRYLPQARDNLGLEGLLAKGRTGAAKTYAGDAPKGATVRLRAVGDMMIGTDFPDGYLPPDDAQGTFAGVADWLRDADLTFGNLEGPLCDGGTTDKCGPNSAPGTCYAFRSPARYAPLYQDAGFDVVSTANNHAGDFGEECRVQTERHLDGAGIEHTGRPGDVATLTRNGIKIGFIGFHTSRSTHYVNDHETAQTLVRALGAENDLVVVSFHGGAEGAKAIHVPHGHELFHGEDRGDLRAFARAAVDAGADLVLGHGPHVLRGMEVYKDRLVVYSMGNFATYGRFSLGGWSGIGAVVEVTLDSGGKFIGGRILPTRQEGEGRPVKDADGKAIDLIRTLSEEDFPETAVKVGQDGAIGAH